MAFQHGVYIQELDTKILGVRTCDSALPFVVGTAPVESLQTMPINEAKICYSYQEYITTFGEVPTNKAESNYTLSEFARIYYTLYGMTPVIFVNVFDPSKHMSGDPPVPDVTAVKKEDIIGGVDVATGKRTGLEIIEETFTKFGKVVGYVLAPGFSYETTVATALKGKAEKVCNHFKAMTIIDVPPTVAKPSEAITFKADIGSPHAIVVWPKALYGTGSHWLSNHVASLSAKVDEKNTGIPYESPSNKELIIDGPSKILSIQEANSLNEQGIGTIFRFSTGWKFWGNRTAAFPETTDIKDTFIPTRRMANWIENNLVLLSWQKIDDPMNKRLIESVVSTVNIWLNGLVGRSFLIGAKVYFRSEDNPLTDLANGIIRFYITYLAPPPAETIEHILEVDVNYFSNLFGG